MAVTPKYGSRELTRCLESLGFTLRRKQSGTSHVKYDPPSHVKANPGERSFIIVQLNIKNYDSNACSRWINQIKAFGFSREEVINALTK